MSRKSGLIGIPGKEAEVTIQRMQTLDRGEKNTSLKASVGCSVVFMNCYTGNAASRVARQKSREGYDTWQESSQVLSPPEVSSAALGFAQVLRKRLDDNSDNAWLKKN